MITYILAVDQKGTIGNAGGLPWPRLPADMEHFRNLTLGHVVLMGRKTWESLPKKLTGRTNVVLSSQSLEGPDLIIRSLDEIPQLAKKFENISIHIIGGASIYQQAIGYPDVIHLTKIQQEYPGDASVDLEMILKNFSLSYRFIRQGLDGDIHYPTMTFETYRRIS